MCAETTVSNCLPLSAFWSWQAELFCYFWVVGGAFVFKYTKEEKSFAVLEDKTNLI